jgi:hypothetical protein
MSSGALRLSRAKSESSLMPLSGAYSPGNADRVRLYNNKFFYREPGQADRQVQTVNMRRLKIGLRTRLIETVQSKHFCAFKHDSVRASSKATRLFLTK